MLKGFDQYRRQIREEIWRRDEGRCVYCSRPLKKANMTVDHVVAIGNGGIDEYDNLVLCCRYCNSAKSDHPIEQFREKLKWKLNNMPYFSPDQVAYLRQNFGVDVAPKDKRFWFERRMDGDPPLHEPGARYSYEGRKRRPKKRGRT